MLLQAWSAWILLFPMMGQQLAKLRWLIRKKTSVTISVTSVDFGTVQNAWARSYQRGIKVDPITITLPYNGDKEIDVKIDLKMLAQDFWGSSHYVYKFAEYTSYGIVVHLNNGITVSDILTVLDKPLELSKVGVACSIIGGIGAGIATRANPRAAIAGAILGYALGAGLEKLYWELYLVLRDANWSISSDNDGNSVNGR